jgi:hypothetical protein
MYMNHSKVMADEAQQTVFASFLRERSKSVSIVMGCLMVGAWLSNHSVSEAAQAVHPIAEQADISARQTAPVLARFDSAADAQAYEKDRQVQVEACTKREQLRLKREEAASKMEESRKNYQFFSQQQWTSVIYTNLETFNALRSDAAHSNGESIPCSICSAHGSLNFCFLCKNGGKCPGCEGTGEESFGKICPTCLGTGHCFLCHGTGKMTCPFCDDGQVGAHQHDPSASLPVH